MIRRSQRKRQINHMLNKILLLIFCFTLFSCAEENKSVMPQTYYIIKHAYIDKKEFGNKPPPSLPPVIQYGNYNFILLDTSLIYFYVLNSSVIGTDLFANVGLTSKQVSKIEIDSLHKFLKVNIPRNDGDKTATISYPTDSIKNRAVNIIAEYFNTNGFSKYNIRNITKEEAKAIIF